MKRFSTTLALIWSILLLSLSTAQAKKKTIPCSLPGDSEHWRAAYCLYQSETDDLRSKAVQQCLATTKQLKHRITACAKKHLWKEEICKKINEPDDSKTNQCIDDKTFIPDYVRQTTAS